MNINFIELEELLLEYTEYSNKVEKIIGRKITKRDQILPLFVELGELLNEYPTMFKFWRQSAKDNRSNGLEEFADCLNFIFGAMSINDLNIIKDNLDSMHDSVITNENTDIIYNFYTILDNAYKEENIVSQFYNLMAIGYKLNYTWNDIYKASKNKIKIINERLDNGY